MVRKKDQKMTGFEKTVCTSQLPRERGVPYHAGPHGKYQGQSGGRRSKEKCEQKPLLWLCPKEWAMQGGQAYDSLF